MIMGVLRLGETEYSAKKSFANDLPTLKFSPTGRFRETGAALPIRRLNPAGG
jgi:hypothetical protein